MNDLDAIKEPESGKEVRLEILRKEDSNDD